MKKLMKNYLYNLSYQILIMILPLITTPYISRVLQANGVGQYNYAYAIVSVAIIIAQLGTNMYGQREIAYVQNDKRNRSNVFWSIFFIRTFTSLIIIPLYIIFSLYLNSYTNILLSMIIFLIANIFDISWLFQGMEDFKKTVIRSIIVKVTGVVLIFALVKKESDVIIYSTILGTSQLIGNLILWGYLPKFINIFCFHEIKIKSHIKPILGLFLPTAAVYVYTYVDKIFLGMFSTDTEVGFYSQPEKIIKLLMTIITSLGTVMLPHIAAELKNNNIKKIQKQLLDSISFVIGLSFPMVIGAILIANRFIPWFLGTGYEKSIILFQLMSSLIFIIGLASVVGQAILVPLQKQKVYTTSIFLGALINLIINFLLIPRYAALGATIGTIFAELTVTCIQFWEVKKCVGLSINNILLSNKSYFISTSVMGIIGVILNLLLPNKIIYMFVIILLCIVVYIICLIITKDKLILENLNKLKKGEKI